MKICVTGGAGFIGSYIVNELAQRYDVFVIDDLSTGKRENLNQNIKLIEADIFSNESFKAIKSEKPEVLFHFASSAGVRRSIDNYIFDIQKNLFNAVKFIDFCLRNKVKKVIFASSGGTVYGDAKVIPTPEDYPLRPISSYGASKAAVEFYLEILCKKFGAELLILRYANVYGLRQRPDTDAGVISIFADLMKKNKNVFIYGDGSQTRDYIYISDVINLTLAAFDKNLNGVFNVGTGVETSLNQIFEILKNILNYKKPPIYKKFIQGEIFRCSLNINKISKALGIYPSTKIEQGIKSFVML